MRKYHLVCSGASDFDEIERQAAQKQRPRHSIPMLTRRLGATLHQAQKTATTITIGDRLRARLIGDPHAWALARDLANRLGPDDVVYCLDTGVGIPLAAAFQRLSTRPKLVVYVHNLDRPRGRLAAGLFRPEKTVDLFVSCCSSQLAFLRDDRKVPEDRTQLFIQHIDNQFFTPGPPTPGKKRPVVVAVGRERRDYITLAEATKDLDVDVLVDAWSPAARKRVGKFPAEPPANLAYRNSTPTELVQLYRDADVVAVPMYPNKYAGITSLIEALACERPIVASRVVGLADYLTPPDGITPVEPSDPAALRTAIVQLLKNPDEARVQARQGFESVARRYDFDRDLEMVARRLESL